MEKKTIGQFIATLRKANGMTQKQLAEKLNVSDKAVSRWERDESAPDLTLIPVIAEIFRVTSDELLRGEKQNEEIATSPRGAEKTEKQLDNLLKGVQLKLNVRGIVSVGIAIIGLIVAMICNFGFNRAYLGFFLSCGFCICAAICETIFGIQAFYSINNSEFQSANLNKSLKKIVYSIEKVVSLILAIVAFSLPLVIVPWNAYLGILATTWILYGLICVVIVELVCLFSVWIINTKINEKYSDSQSEIDYIRAKKRLGIKYMIISMMTLVVTMVCQIGFNQTLSSFDFAEGKTFDNIDEFVQYMEKPYDEMILGDEVFFIEEYAMMGDLSSGEMFYEDVEEEYLYSPDGNIIAEYACRNRAVKNITYECTKDGKFASATTYTKSQLNQGEFWMDLINGCFVPIYIMELIIILLIYKKKKKALC